MTPAAVDLAKLMATWAENALQQVRACADPEAWILANAEQMGRCDQYAHGSWVQIKIALDARYRELGR